MKIRTAAIFIMLFSLLTACQTATPQPVSAIIGTEFALSAGQTVTLRDANISITFVSILSDERCPSEIECAASGPVTINLSIVDKNGIVSEEILQTFTDNNGLAPTMEFEGIKSSVGVNEYQVKVTGVLPYPKNRFNAIKTSAYKVLLKVIRN
jgi:hypothetical protein